MKEFMLIIRTQGDHLETLPADKQQQHLGKVMNYIGGLMKNEKLNSAQPLEMEGTIISGSPGKFKDGPFNETKEVIAGYFLIAAKDIDEAVAIAKANPIFKDISTRIEVHPMMPVGGN